MKMISKLYIGLVCVLVLSNFVFASENKKGSIYLELETPDDFNATDNICLCITKVGEMKEGNYIFDSQYLESDIVLDMETSASVTNTIIHELASKVKPDQVTKRTANGGWKFENLDDGIYLIYENDSYESIRIEPSLITIPYYDQVKNNMVYEVSIFPKYTTIVQTPTPVPIPIPETGDTNRIGIYIIIMSASILIGAASVLIRKRNNIV